jgi:hypothetical protein
MMFQAPRTRETEHAFARVVAVTDGYRILQSPKFGALEFLLQKASGESWISLGAHHDAPSAEAEIDLWRAHVREKAARNRPLTTPVGMASPWGLVQTLTTYAPGIVSVTTAEHGGFILDAAANAAIPDGLRNPDATYEEDGEWAKVAFALPAHFTVLEQRDADRILRNAEPDLYTAYTGHVIPLEESQTLRLRAFLAEHAGRFLSCSARRIDDDFVAVSAAVGGRLTRGDGRLPPQRTFRVPAHEYSAKTEFAFVIDPMRHPEIAA